MNPRIAVLGISIFVGIVTFGAHPEITQAESQVNLTKTAETVDMGNPEQSTGDVASTSIPRRDDRYKIHQSDTLSLTFERTPEFNQTLTVQPDGYVVLRSVGGLLAAGQTLPELTQSVKAAYSKILHDPVISIDLKDFEKPYFVVGGQVQKPGKFDWRGEVTLTEAITMAGGFTDTAKHSQVLMFRRISDQWTEAKIINVKKMLNSRDLREDPVLQPGDMLYVPRNAMSKIKPYLPTFSTGAYLPY
jgi:polysaccharide export outer membrane protein